MGLADFLIGAGKGGGEAVGQIYEDKRKINARQQAAENLARFKSKQDETAAQSNFKRETKLQSQKDDAAMARAKIAAGAKNTKYKPTVWTLKNGETINRDEAHKEWAAAQKALEGTGETGEDFDVYMRRNYNIDVTGGSVPAKPAETPTDAQIESELKDYIGKNGPTGPDWMRTEATAGAYGKGNTQEIFSQRYREARMAGKPRHVAMKMARKAAKGADTTGSPGGASTAVAKGPRVVKITGPNDPALANVKSGDIIELPDGSRKRKN